MSLQERIAATTDILPFSTTANEAHLVYRGKTLVYHRRGAIAVPAYDMSQDGYSSFHREAFAQKALQAMNDAEQPRLEAAE